MQPEELKIDKSEWLPGPWHEEPDRVDFEHVGFPCTVLRHSTNGHLCGYVAVPPGHPLHGVEYDSPSEALRQRLERRENEPLGDTPGMGVMISLLRGELEPRPDVALNVHGGLTYSAACGGHICHVPKEGEPDNVWWFGFDCNHYGDYGPGSVVADRKMNFAHAGPGGHMSAYRTVEYVKRECMRLAEQLREVQQ